MAIPVRFWKFSLSTVVSNGLIAMVALAQAPVVDPYLGRPRAVSVFLVPQVSPKSFETFKVEKNEQISASPAHLLSTPFIVQEPPLGRPSTNDQTPSAAPAPKPKGVRIEAEDVLMGISIGEPPRDTLFRMETEKELRQRLKLENEHWRNLKIEDAKAAFPTGLSATRGWRFHDARVEPNGVASGRLWFEQTGPERYGRDFGPASTLISVAWFHWDLVLWPVRLATPPWQCIETSAGRALPGDPQPRRDFGFPYRTWRVLP